MCLTLCLSCACVSDSVRIVSGFDKNTASAHKSTVTGSVVAFRVLHEVFLGEIHSLKYSRPVVLAPTRYFAVLRCGTSFCCGYTICWLNHILFGVFLLIGEHFGL